MPKTFIMDMIDADCEEVSKDIVYPEATLVFSEGSNRSWVDDVRKLYERGESHKTSQAVDEEYYASFCNSDYDVEQQFKRERRETVGDVIMIILCFLAIVAFFLIAGELSR